MEPRELRARVDAVPFWWHSIDLGQGVVTPGQASLDALEAVARSLRIPDVTGKTVLDIGAWDGFFSFEMERRGARRVVALDHYQWSLDLEAEFAYWRDCRDRGVSPEPYHLVPGLWHPDTLPGMRGFETAREALGSAVEPKVADLMAADPRDIGAFDLVLYLGVLYHMEDPLGALGRLAAVTREVAVIETAAVAIPGHEAVPLWEFYPGSELNDDISNWWAPNLPALEGAVRAAGFRTVRVMQGPPALPRRSKAPVRYRAIVHAVK